MKALSLALGAAVWGCSVRPPDQGNAPSVAPSASTSGASIPSQTEPAQGKAPDRLAGIAPGEERELGEGVFVLMHRIQATQPLGDGWHLARSTEGSFSVELPLPFNDFRTRAHATDGVELRSHALGGKTAPGLLAWSAACFVRRDGQLGPDKRRPAPDRIELKGTPPVAHARWVEFDDMACVLVVEAQGSDPLPPQADRIRFLTSLERTGKPVW